MDDVMKMMQSTTVIVSFLLVLLCLFLFSSVYDSSLMIVEASYFIVVGTICVAVLLSCLNIYSLFSLRRENQQNHAQSERNIRDYYRYHEVVDPPQMNT